MFSVSVCSFIVFKWTLLNTINFIKYYYACNDATTANIEQSVQYKD